MRLREEVERIAEAVNLDPVFRKRLPREALVVELRSGEEKVLAEVSGRGVRVLREPGLRADVVVSGSRDTLLKILRGEENAVKLFFLGRVKVEGDLVQAYILHERLRELLRV